MDRPRDVLPTPGGPTRQRMGPRERGREGRVSRRREGGREGGREGRRSVGRTFEGASEGSDGDVF